MSGHIAMSWHIASTEVMLAVEQPLEFKIAIRAIKKAINGRQDSHFQISENAFTISFRFHAQTPRKQCAINGAFFDVFYFRIPLF